MARKLTEEEKEIKKMKLLEYQKDYYKRKRTERLEYQKNYYYAKIKTNPDKMEYYKNKTKEWATAHKKERSEYMKMYNKKQKEKNDNI